MVVRNQIVEVGYNLVFVPVVAKSECNQIEDVDYCNLVEIVVDYNLVEVVVDYNLVEVYNY